MHRRIGPLAFLLGAVLLAGCGSLSDSELKREVLSIHSRAAEGEILARDVARDRTKATFVRAHAGELASALHDSAEKLADAQVPEELTAEVQSAIELASDAADQLDRMRVKVADERVAESVKQHLSTTADDADALAGRL